MQKTMNKTKKSRPGLKEEPAIRQMLSQAVENAFDGICMADIEGRVVYANPAALAMFGYYRKDAQGMNLRKFAAYPGKLSEILKFVITKGRYNATRTGLRKSGDKFPIHMTATLARDAAGNNIGIMIIFRDLSGTREAENKIQLSEERYRALVDSARDFIYSIDRDGRVIAANKAANAIFGRKTGGIMGKKLGDLFVPAVAARYLNGIRKVFRTGKILTAENDLHPKKKGRRSIDTILTPVKDINSRVVSVLGVTRDVTRLKQAEAEVRHLNADLEKLVAQRTAELRASEQKYRHLVETVQEGIWALDRNARTTFVNRAMARMLGYTAGEMTGKSVFDFLDAKGRKILKGKLKNRRRGVKEQYDLEFVCKNGTRFHGLVAGAPRMGVNGRYEGAIASILDITQRKLSEEELVFKNSLLAVQHEAALDGILVVDENSKIVMFNRRFAEIWGIPGKIMALRSDKRALGFVLNRLANPDEFLQKVKYLYAHKKETSRDEISLADARILDRYSAPLFGPDGKYYGRAWYFRDITARKQSEEILAASEERFREISLSMTDFAYSCIRAPGKAPQLNWVTGAVQALSGYTEKEFLALGCWQKLVLEDDLPVFVKNVSGLAPGAAGKCELRLRKKDGSILWVLSSCHCVADRSCPGRTILYGGLSDIDRRKKIEQKLHESEEKFSKAFHNAPVMILITALGDGRIIEVNDSFIDATGFSRAEIIGKRTVELGFIKPEEMQKIADFVRAKGGLRNFELKVRGKDGSELDCMLSFDLFVLAGKKCLLTVAKDITEIRQAENERRLSAEKYHAIFMESPIGIELFDESGRLVMINKACLDIFGVVDEKELNDFNLFCVPNLTEDRKARLRAGELLRYQAPFDFEQLKQSRLYRTRHSGVIWLDVLIVPLRASPGGLLVQVQDITGRMQAQDKLEQANRRLKEALDQLKKTERQVIQNERLGALGQMASGISHEFNNILVPIVGYADLLLTKEDKLNDRQELLKMLRMILAAALDAREVIKRLQDFARPKDEDSREMVFLPELAENVVMLLRPKWKEEMGLKGVLINIKSEFRDMPPVQCIRAQVKEVLTNIILNAVDALPEGGTITIRGRHLKPENAVELQIVDTGTGISPAVQQHIFEPYFTTKGGERSGLGLAITHGIVSAHNGTIKFDSALGKGTTVTIRLPVGQPVAPAVEARLPEAASRPLRILFIDDNENVRLLIAEFLKADGHTVALAAEGHEGLAQAGEGRFDLVITDSAMPDMSGGELAAAIKTIKQDLPVIMLTGFGDIMNAKREIPVGVEMVLAKPITQEGLRKAISKIMAGRA